jgi:hypothetical protein
MITRWLWLLFALSHLWDPEVGAVRPIMVAGQQIRTGAVLPWTLRTAVIPVVLVTTATNGLLVSARWVAHSAIEGVTRRLFAGVTAAFPGTITTRPVPQPGPDGPRHQTPNLAPGTGSGPTTSSNHRPGRETVTPKINKTAKPRRSSSPKPQHTRSATFSGRSS